MTINSYLNGLARSAIMGDQEKTSIQRSIVNLEERLRSYFDDQPVDSFVFGSYSRGTILPRYMDEDADIDYMVIFSDGGLRPQSYLDRLRRFAESNYQRSDIEQSNPTIVLSLSHIRFELVPATESWGNLQIPAKASDYHDWITTDPTDFNDKLVNANKANASQIKPLVRVMKYWNASCGYPFESYELEQRIAKKTYWYGFLGLQTAKRLDEYYYQFVDAVECGWSDPQWKKDAVTRLKQLTAEARSQEKSGDGGQAEALLTRLLPPVGGILGR